MIAVLRQRNFGLLWIAGLLSLIGDWAFYTLIPVYILDRTGSVFYSGIVWTIIAFPQVFLGPIAGVYVDRHSRQRIMIWSSVAQAIAMATLLMVGGNMGVWFAFAVLLAQAILATIYSPAENALLPTVVVEKDLPTANALNSLNDNIARIAGPMVGTVLYAWIDIRGAALVNLISFALAATLVGLVTVPQRTRSRDQAEHESVMESLRDGARHVRQSPLLRTLFLIEIMMALADGPLTAMLTAFIRDTLHRSAADVGVFFSMRGVAGVLGGIVIAQTARRFRPDRTLILCLFVISGEIILLAVVRNFWLIILLMVLVGPVFAAFNTVLPTLLQVGSEDSWRGRMFALNGALAGGTYAISTLIGSVLGGLTSPPFVMVVSGLLYFVAATIALIRLPPVAKSVRPGETHVHGAAG